MTSFKIIALLLGAISAAGYKGEKRQAGGISASFSDEERCYGDPDCFFELTVNNVTYPVCWETYTTDAAAYNLANFLRAACADVGKLGDEEPAIFGILPEYGEYSHYWSVLPCSVEYGDNLQDYQDCVSLVSEATCGNNTPAMFFAVLCEGCMERMLVRLSGVVVRKPVRDDDTVDRLHHNVSLIIILLFASGTALQEYVGEPINCWTPSKFPQEHYTQHVNGYCWTHLLRYPESSKNGGTTGLSPEQLLKQRRLINFGTAFYRWVTIIFVLQAVLFKLPNLIWSYLNRQSGASLQKLRDLVMEAQLEKGEERGNKMDEAADYLHSWLAAYRISTARTVFGRDIGKLACLFQCAGRRSGKYLCVVYLMVKVLYLVNVVGNFVLLTVFLDADFWRYGVSVLNDVLVHGDWHDPVNFPRLLLCDFYLHQSDDDTDTQSGTVNTNTANGSTGTGDGNQMNVAKIQTLQCVLSINIMLEKLFVIMWFWLVLLLLLTMVTLVTWSVGTVCKCAPYLFARKFMKTLPRSMDELETRARERFVLHYLRQDGIFILRMLESNTDHMIVRELVLHLWDNYRTADTSSVEMTEDVDAAEKEEVV